MNLVTMNRMSVLATGAVLGLASAASAAHVDFFDAGGFFLNVVPGESRTLTQSVPPGPTGALGGLRQVTATNDGTAQPVNVNLSVDNPDVNNDAVQLSLGSSNTPGNVLFEYGGFTDAGDLNADFLNIPADDGSDTGMNWTMITVNLTQVTGRGTATVTLASDSGDDSATVSQDFNASDSNSNLSLLYSDFFADDSDLDLTDIDSVSLNITGNAGLTAGISFFGRAGSVPDNGGNVIPTPAAATAGLAMLGGLMLRRRRD